MSLGDRIPYQAIVDRPRLHLPGGARIAVWIIVNVEEWRIERPMPRTVLPPPMGEPLLPDVPNWSWHEYGMRSGFWRQYAALATRELPATLAINGAVCDRYPRVAEAALTAGWEFMGHGYSQGPMHRLEHQGEAIAEALHRIRTFSGQPVRSWESPGLTETGETLDLLRANGVEFVADWVIDDLPQDIETPSGTITTLPYTVETNDIVVHALQGHPAEEFLRRGRAQFDRLWSEGAENARVMAISVHPYITGVPHRIAALERLLDHIMATEGVVWMTATEIGDWYRQQIEALPS
ncbi:MAG: polysaccharide deacetylase family protein [Pseudomonadota bacterium]